jgi:hypothetical protein
MQSSRGVSFDSKNASPDGPYGYYMELLAPSNADGKIPQEGQAKAKAFKITQGERALRNATAPRPAFYVPVRPRAPSRAHANGQ